MENVFLILNFKELKKAIETFENNDKRILRESVGIIAAMQTENDALTFFNLFGNDDIGIMEVPTSPPGVGTILQDVKRLTLGMKPIKEELPKYVGETIHSVQLIKNGNAMSYVQEHIGPPEFQEVIDPRRVHLNISAKFTGHSEPVKWKLFMDHNTGVFNGSSSVSGFIYSVYGQVFLCSGTFNLLLNAPVESVDVWIDFCVLEES